MIQFDKTWIDKIICESPFVKLLSVPKFNDIEGRWECLAQVNEILAWIEVTVKPKENQNENL